MDSSSNEPIQLLSLGAGVQSSTLALMAARGEVGPMPQAAIFADTQAEPASVYQWLDWLEKQIPFPVYRVTSGSLTEEALRLRKNKTGRDYVKSLIPAYVFSPEGKKGLLGRKCTADFKVKPIMRLARKLGQVPRACKQIKVVQWIGISLDEVHRMKPSRDKWAGIRWPLIEKEMTRNDCLNWMRRNGYPEPPRSACIYCPFHSDHEWKRLRDKEPDEWLKAVKFDYDLRAIFKKETGVSALRGTAYLHASGVPLDKAELGDIPDKNQLSLFGNECEGLCGV